MTRNNGILQLEPSKVHWNGMLNSKCYTTIPVEINNSTVLFQKQGSMDLTNAGTRIKCELHQVPHWHTKDGRLRNVHGYAAVAKMTINNIQKLPSAKQLIFNDDSLERKANHWLKSIEELSTDIQRHDSINHEFDHDSIDGSSGSATPQFYSALLRTTSRTSLALRKLLAE